MVDVCWCLRLPWITPPDFGSIWPWNITHLLEWLSHSFPSIVICSMAMLYYHSRICHDLSFSCSKKSCIGLGFSAKYLYSLSVWWFQTWILFSISYMGCHPSHWRTHIFLYMVIAPPTSDVFCFQWALSLAPSSWMFVLNGTLTGSRWIRKRNLSTET